MDEGYDWALYAWAIDFVRSVEEMSLLRKSMLRFVLGRFAAREYVGLREHLEKECDGTTQIGYGLERCEYHFKNWRWIYG